MSTRARRPSIYINLTFGDEAWDGLNVDNDENEEEEIEANNPRKDILLGWKKNFM